MGGWRELDGEDDQVGTAVLMVGAIERDEVAQTTLGTIRRALMRWHADCLHHLAFPFTVERTKWKRATDMRHPVVLLVDVENVVEASKQTQAAIAWPEDEIANLVPSTTRSLQYVEELVLCLDVSAFIFIQRVCLAFVAWHCPEPRRDNPRHNDVFCFGKELVVGRVISTRTGIRRRCGKRSKQDDSNAIARDQ